MRAKRSKKYRKLMHQYELTFGFREPYQVLVDSNLLRAVHSFKMDLVPALERTLQGKVKPFITKCSLAAVMASSPSEPNSRPNARPAQLPPPTVLPLRYCSHNQDSKPIDEVDCLLSLLSPSPEIKKNKEHYILATADTPAAPEPSAAKSNNSQKKNWKSTVPALAPEPPANLLRIGARQIPGVPIIYVKRSVMILEPLSGSSESVREGVERGKFKTGVTKAVVGKRKRGDEEGDEDGDGGDDRPVTTTKEKKPKKVKGPNPLSVKKPKKKAKPSGGGGSGGEGKEEREVAEVKQPAHDAKVGDSKEASNEGGESTGKTKRKRRHKSHKSDKAGEAGTAQPEGPLSVES
ncbi:hypothetical protein AJ79_01256 [Helicocarpus griseus UAMH5409]|uniref:UTP23 sensor motif region domain-containing protein n=1 Tax=Helicocarpus griseus UAMH5409 TaxID=1447875 RepID=A0A2B7Y866_9EURO|nr:hypothetical protein AJ79_01256 [Helicocarpus griseus UAMH5409]